MGTAAHSVTGFVTMGESNAMMLRWWQEQSLRRDARECSPTSFYWRERFEEDRKW